MVFGRAERAKVVGVNKNMTRTQTRTQYARTSYRADKFSVIWSAFTNAALPELANRPGFCRRDFAVRSLDKKTKSFGKTFKGQDIAPPTFTETASMPWSDCMAGFHPPHHEAPCRSCFVFTKDCLVR